MAKSYATTYVENNNASAGSTATRNADSLSYTLDKPLASRWSASIRYKPQQASSARSSNAVFIAGTNAISTASASARYFAFYDVTNHKFTFEKSVDGTTWVTASTSTISYNANDDIALEIIDDPTNNLFGLWLSINGSTVQNVTVTNSTSITDVQFMYIGCGNTTGNEANGTIECILHELASGETVSTDEVTALFNASDWGLGDYPSIRAPFNDPSAIVFDAYGNIHVKPTAPSSASWNVIDANGNVVFSVPTGSSYAQSSTLQTNGHNLAQVLSGGYKIQSGAVNISVTTAGANVTQSITFPNAIISNAVVLLSVNSVSNPSSWVSVGSSNITASGFTLNANSGVSNGLSVAWCVLAM